MIGSVLATVRSWQEDRTLPGLARVARDDDRRRTVRADPGLQRTIDEALAWLCRAQDRSASADGGVARHFSLIDGWSTSYPETTGYIVPTMLDEARRRGDASLEARAHRMLDWLVSIQLRDGGFQGGLVDSDPVVPVTFNTGQILLGLAAGVAAYGDEYRSALQRAGDWLVRTQDADGAWRRHPTPFAAPGEKVYETHVAWGLLEAARVEPGRGYAESALANIRWALGWQRANGWFDRCCLEEPQRPLTHTIGYVLRGVIEGYRFSGDEMLLAAARRTADAIVVATRADGWLAGRLDASWRPAVRWSCLTGSAQIAHCLFLLSLEDENAQYRATARALTAYVRRVIRLDGHDGLRGGVPGSFPIDGEYGRFEVLNWSAKFLIDALRLEEGIASRE